MSVKNDFTWTMFVSNQVEGKTGHQKVRIILDTVVAKGVQTFLDFCLVLGKRHMGQGHIVTEVLNLSMEYVRRQRGQ